MATVNLGRIKPTWQGTWSSSTSYVADDIVYYNNHAWIAVATNTNSAPSDGNSNWDKMANGANIPTGATSGQVLTAGASDTYTWETLPPSDDASALTQGTLPAARLPAGTTQNIQHVVYDTPVTVTGSSYTTVMSVNITPTSSTSKVLVRFDFSGWQDGSGTFHLRLYRNSTAIALGQGRTPQDTIDGIDVGQPGDASAYTGMTFLDSPGTTSQVTYSIRMHPAGSTCHMNRTGNDSSTDHDSRTISTMTVMEVLQ